MLVKKWESFPVVLKKLIWVYSLWLTHWSYHHLALSHQYVIINEHSRLTHWGRVTHICISKLTIIGSDNGLSPGRRQAIIWTNNGILLIRTFRTHFSEIVSEIHTFSLKKMHLKMSSGKWRPSCLGLNVLNWHTLCGIVYVLVKPLI